MPIYEFECIECELGKEVFGHMSDKTEDIAPACICGKKMTKVFTTCSYHMKRKTLGDFMKERRDDPKHLRDEAWFFEQSRKGGKKKGKKGQKDV